MVKIKSIHIQKFRGIKDLKVSFDKKSWVIHGRNGSGKSGVIDAIEFGLSGVIGRLTGEGRGDVSIKDHGPHVDSKTSPKDSVITLVFEFEGSKELTIIRRCDNPTKPKLIPEGNVGEELYSKLYFGKEVVLSRRDILKFVLTEPGKRSKEVQSLLRIEKLEEIRSAFKTTCNKISGKRDSANSSLREEENRLAEWLGNSELLEAELLEAVNKRRKQLNLSKIIELKNNTVVNADIEISKNNSIFYSKKDLKGCLSKIKEKIEGSDSNFNDAFDDYTNLLSEFKRKENIQKQISRLSLLESGLSMIEENECPLCEKEWEKEILKNKVEEKIKELSDVKTISNKLEEKVNIFKTTWSEIKELINNYTAKTENEPILKITILSEIIEEIDTLLSDENSSLSRFERLKDYKELSGIKIKKENFQKCFDNAIKVIGALPEKSNEDEAKDFLRICQERLESYRNSKRTYELHEGKLKIISEVLEKYNQITESYLNDLYNEIESDFSRFYQIVNEDDEASFTGNLTAKKGALDFKVDFYNRGKFPPAAYHSEGHQDGMGLCLYLALMKKILNTDFTIAILDDVLMSIDSAHRKCFCKLLKTEFPDTQFIITTHDEYWQKQMITEELVTHASSLKFKNWSVDTGPTVWSDKESWEIINSFLNEENISEAASELRRFLEYYCDEVAVRIKAKVLKNASGDHGLGELLSAISSRYIELLKKAIKSASSWGKNDLSAQYGEQKSVFNEILKKAQSELWAVNSSVHFNKWANMDKNEFIELKNTYKKLVSVYKCMDCNTLLHVVSTIGSSETLKCDCSARAYNLKIKN